METVIDRIKRIGKQNATPSEAGLGVGQIGPREQAIIDRHTSKAPADSSILQKAARGIAQLEIGTRQQQRAYAEQAPPEVVEPVKEMLANLGDRRKVLGIIRQMTPEQRAEALKLVPGVAQQFGDDRGNFIARGFDAIGRGVTHGVSQPIMEIVGAGGTNEEIEFIRQLDAAASQEFNPTRPGDPWYQSGPLQAIEMAPWMATTVGGAGLGRTVASGVAGKIAAKSAAGGKIAGALGKAGEVAGKVVSAGKVGELAGTTAASFAPQYVQEVDQLKELGMEDGWKRRLLAGGTATVIGLWEGAVPNPFKAGQVSLKEGAANAARQYLWNAVKQAPGEMSEEWLQGVTSGLGEHVAQYLDENAKDKSIGEAFAKGWKQTGEAALPMGFLLGVPAIGGASLAAARAERVRRSTIVQGGPPAVSPPGQTVTVDGKEYVDLGTVPGSTPPGTPTGTPPTGTPPGVPPSTPSAELDANGRPLIDMGPVPGGQPETATPDLQKQLARLQEILQPKKNGHSWVTDEEAIELGIPEGTTSRSKRLDIVKEKAKRLEQEIAQAASAGPQYKNWLDFGTGEPQGDIPTPPGLALFDRLTGRSAQGTPPPAAEAPPAAPPGATALPPETQGQKQPPLPTETAPETGWNAMAATAIESLTNQAKTLQWSDEYLKARTDQVTLLARQAMQGNKEAKAALQTITQEATNASQVPPNEQTAQVQGQGGQGRRDGGTQGGVGAQEASEAQSQVPVGLSLNDAADSDHKRIGRSELDDTLSYHGSSGVGVDGEFYDQVDATVGSRFDAHGLSKGSPAAQARQLDNLLGNGIDTTKDFYTAPFQVSKENAAGAAAGLGTAGGTAYKNGVAVVTGGYGVSIKDGGIRNIFINDAMPQLKAAVEAKYGDKYNVHFLSEQKAVLESQSQGATDASKVSTNEGSNDARGDGGKGSQVDSGGEVRVEGQEQGGTQPTSEKPATQEVPVRTPENPKPGWNVVKYPDGKLYREDPNPNLSNSERMRTRQVVDPATEGPTLMTHDPLTGKPINSDLLKLRQEFIDGAQEGATFRRPNFNKNALFEVGKNGQIYSIEATTKRPSGTVHELANHIKKGDIAELTKPEATPVADVAKQPSQKPSAPQEMTPEKARQDSVDAAPQQKESGVVQGLSQKYPELKERFEADAGVSEGYTVGEHTQRVVERLDLTDVPQHQRKVLQLTAALHDIGKGEAVAGGDKSKQHQYTLPIMRKVLSAEGLTDADIAFAEAIVDQDIIGEMLQGKMSPMTAAAKLETQAKKAGIDQQSFLTMAKALYKADAGSYPRVEKAVMPEGKITDTKLGVLEEQVHGQAIESPWIGGIRAAASKARREESGRGAGLIHASAYDIQEFDENKDSGKNLVGPGVYLLTEQDIDVAKHYADRALNRVLSLFSPAARQKIQSATNGEEYDNLIRIAQQRRESEPQNAERWTDAITVLRGLREGQIGKHIHTVEVDLPENTILDLGSEDTGGRILSETEREKIATAVGMDVSTLPKRGMEFYKAIANVKGKKTLNEALQSIGYRGIAFLHRKGGYSRRYPVLNVLNPADANIKPPAPQQAEATTEELKKRKGRTDEPGQKPRPQDKPTGEQDTGTSQERPAEKPSEEAGGPTTTAEQEPTAAEMDAMMKSLADEMDAAPKPEKKKPSTAKPRKYESPKKSEKTQETAAEKRKQASQALRNALKGLDGTTPTTGLNPKIGLEVLKAVKLYIEADILDFKSFVESVVEDLGEAWLKGKERYLESAWRVANDKGWVDSPAGKVADVLPAVKVEAPASQRKLQTGEIGSAPIGKSGAIFSGGTVGVPMYPERIDLINKVKAAKGRAEIEQLLGEKTDSYYRHAIGGAPVHDAVIRAMGWDKQKDAIQPPEKTAAKAEETDVDKTLRQAGLKVEQLPDGTWQITGNTYEHSKEIGDVKREVSELGGWFHGKTRKSPAKWTFRGDPRRAIADRLAGKGIGEESRDAGSRNEQLAREDARQQQDKRADVQRASEDYVASVHGSTQDLVARGLNYGMTQEVVDSQIEDIGRVVDAAENDRKMFIVGSAPGTGKTFVLGGVIRELRRRGFEKFVYVTQNENLIDQVQGNLADYGLEGVTFTTYAKVRDLPPNTEGAVLLLDEAHSAKNADTSTGQKIKGMVSGARFTVYATATPFENVKEAEYLAPSGIFDDLHVEFERPSNRPGGKPFRNELHGFNAWAWMHGAEVYFIPQTDRRGNKYLRPVLAWKKHTTAEDDQIAANEWLKKRGVYVQRPMNLPTGTVNWQLRSIEADPYWADISNEVIKIYDDAEATAESDVEKGGIRRHKKNVLKRLLEVSKVDAAIARAKELIGEGKKDDPQVIIFVNTKVETDLGTYTLSEPYLKERGIKGKEAKRRYKPAEIDRMMLDWELAKKLAKRGEDVGPPPFATFIHKIAMAMDRAGMLKKFDSVIDKIMNEFPGQAVEFSGRTPSQNADNLAKWKNNEAKLIVATMDKGGTGLSFHDTTGKMPSRYQVNMNLPWSGTKVEQVSGRLARYGTAKPVTLEWLFASNIPFDRELSKTVGSRMRSMSAGVQGRKSGEAKQIRDFDFEDLQPESPQNEMHYPDGSAYRKWMNRKHQIGDKPTSWLSGHSSDKVREAAKNNPGLGLVITPSNVSYVNHGGDYSHIMVDNGAFSEFTGNAPFSEDKFFALLDKVVAAGLKDKVQFVVVPDKVGDWKGTNERWKEFNERVRAYGMPLAYVGQDGIEEHTDQIPWDDFDVFFIGGSTPWKLGYDPKGKYKDFNRPTDVELMRAGYLKARDDLMKEAKRRGKRIHMGRVNSLKRMEVANYGTQVNSADGNFIGAAPDINLPIVLGWLERTGGDMFRERVQQIQDSFPVSREVAITADILMDLMALPGETEIAPKGTPIPGDAVTQISKAAAKMKEEGKAYSSESAFFKMWDKFLRAVGGKRLSLKSTRKAVEEAVEDIASWIEANPQYLDYYAKDMQAERDSLVEIHPELRDDANWALFKVISGIASNNAPLAGNVTEQINAYASYAKDGRIDATAEMSDKGQWGVGQAGFTLYGGAQGVKALHYQTLNTIIKQQGGAEGAVVWLMGRVKSTPSGMKAARQSVGLGPMNGTNIAGIKATVEAATGQSEEVPRSFAIFGPKVGAYVLNHLGQSEYTTVDVWESRFWRSFFKDVSASTGLEEDTETRAAFIRAANAFAEMLGLSPSAAQAARWFYVIQKMNEAGYTYAREKDRVSVYTAREVAKRQDKTGADAGRKRKTAKPGAGRKSSALRSLLGGTIFGEEVAPDTLYQGQARTRRIDMNFKDVTKRIPELQDAARLLKDGKLSKEGYAELVDEFKPVVPYSFVPEPATAQDAERALSSSKQKAFGNTSETIPAGTKVELRLDIPAYKDHGVWINSIHHNVDGNRVTSYDSYSAATDIDFRQSVANQRKALDVATGEATKSPFAVIKGKWNPISKEDAVERAKEALNSREWVQVGYDPERHSYFYDRSTMEPLESADEVIQIGPLVLAKNPVYGQIDDALFQKQRDQQGTIQAWTHFVNASKAIIGATDKADVSSFFHELGHPMRKFLFNKEVSQEERGNITDDDIDYMEKFLGVENGNWNRDNEERFVDALMKYWREGNHPDKQVESIFKKISAWLSNVLSVLQRDIELDDRVRAIFNKVHQRGGIDPKKLQALREAEASEKSDIVRDEPSDKQDKAEFDDVFDDVFGEEENSGDDREKIDSGSEESEKRPEEDKEAPRRIEGRSTKVGKRKAHYEVVEISDLTASHHPFGLTVNEQFPEGWQKHQRRYEKLPPGQKLEVALPEGGFDPDVILDPTRGHERGPTMAVRHEGKLFVVGGTRRFMMLANQYDRGADKGQSYHDALVNEAEEFGVESTTVGNMNQPILVRVIDEHGDVASLIDELNVDVQFAKDVAAEAASLGRAVGRNTVAVLRSMGDEETLNKFLDRKGIDVLNGMVKDNPELRSKMPGWVRDDSLTKDAKLAVQNAIMGAVIPDARLLSQASPRILQSVNGALSELVALNQKGGEWDLSKRLEEAITYDAEFRASGETVTDANIRKWMKAEQQSFLEGFTKDANSDGYRLWRYLLAHGGSRKFRQALQGTMIREARLDNDSGGLFGDAEESMSGNEAFELLITGGNQQIGDIGGSQDRGDTGPLFQSQIDPKRQAAMLAKDAFNGGAKTFNDYVDYAVEIIGREQVKALAQSMEAFWNYLRANKEAYNHLPPAGNVSDILEAKPEPKAAEVEPAKPEKPKSDVDKKEQKAEKPEQKKKKAEKPEQKKKKDEKPATPDRTGPRVAGVRPPGEPYPDRQVEREPYGDHELTGMAKAVMNDLRELAGIPELEAAPPETIEQWARDAQLTIAADPHAPTRLLNEIVANPARALDHHDVMLLAFRYRELANQAEPHFQELVDANASGDPERITKARTNFILARQPMTEFEELTLKAKSTWGRTGVALQVMMRRDNTVAGLLRRAREANHGKPLTPEQEIEMRELAKRFADLQKKLDEETARADKAEAEIASLKHLTKVVSEPPTRKKPSQQQKSDLDKAWGDIAKLANVNVLFQRDPANPFHNTVAIYRDLGVETFAELRRHVQERLGKEQAAKLDNQFKEAWEATKPETDVPANIDRGNLAQLTREARRIERSIVEGLMQDYSVDAILEMRDQIVKDVHAEMQELLDDESFTYRQTMDALSAYGQFSRPSQDTTDTLLRNLNAEILKQRQIDQLHDAIARKDQLKAQEKWTDEQIAAILINEGLLVAQTGLVRDTPTDRLRDLNRQYNELKKDIPASSEGRAGLLQTAIAAIERGLTNRIRDLNHAIAKKEPIKIGRKESPTNPDIERLKEERDKLLKQYREYFPADKKQLTPEKRLANAIKAAERSIEVIEGQLKSRDFDKTETEALPDSPELTALKQRLTQLQAQRNAAKALELSAWEGEGGAIAQDKAKQTLSEAEKQQRRAKKAIENIQQQLKDLKDGKEKTKVERPDLLEPELRRQLDEWRNRLTAAKQAAKDARLSTWESEGGTVAPDPKEAAYRKAYIASLQNRIAKLQQFMQEGDFSPQQKKLPRILSKRELELKTQLAELNTEKMRKMAEYHLSHLKGVPWVADKISEVLHLARAIETSMDLSALGRQGGLIALGRPSLAKNALVAILKSMKESFDKNAAFNKQDFKWSELEQFLSGIDSREAELAFMHKLTEGKWGEFKQHAGLDLPTTDQAITRQEEVFQGRWGKFVPGVALSSRLYTMVLNKMRSDMFDLMVEKLGRQGEVPLEEAKLIANFINVMTGRSDLGRFNNVAAALNLGFFAPRYVASRFQYLAMPFYLPFKGGLKTNWQIKRAIYREYARTTSGAVLVLGLIALAGKLFWDDDDDDKPTVGVDPTSSDFLKPKFGETRLDFLAGLQQIFVLSSRVAPEFMGGGRIGDKKFSENTGGPFEQNRGTVMARFLRTKLAPGPGYVVTALNDWENVVGKKADSIFGFKSIFGLKIHPSIATTAELFAPLSVRSILDTFETQSVPVAAGSSILSVIGVGMSTYGPKTEYMTGTPEERQELLKNDIENMEWDSPIPAYSEFLTKDQLNKFDKVKQYRFGQKLEAATGDPESESGLKSKTSAIKAIKESGVTYEQARQAMIDHWKSPLQDTAFRKAFVTGAANRLEDYKGKKRKSHENNKLVPDLLKRVNKLKVIYGVK